MSSKKIIFLEEFRQWMIERGAKARKGSVPSVPMSPRTAFTTITFVKRFLKDIDIILSDESMNPNKKIRDISVSDFEEWTKSVYKPDVHSKAYMAGLNKALRKLSEYLHFEKKFRGKPLFSEAKLLKIRDRLYIPQPSKEELEIIEHKKADEFIGWMESKDPLYHMMAYMMRWLGMRYSEAANAPTDIWGVNRLGQYTLRIDRKGRVAYIWGKGRGGLSKRRWLPVRSEIIKKLDKFLKWRTEMGFESPRLFCYHKSSRGTPVSQSSGSYNRTLKDLGIKWGKFTEAEIAMLKSHSIGRHTFGTYYAPVLPAKTGMDYMGIEKFEVYQRYINFSKGEKVDQFEKAHRERSLGEAQEEGAQSSGQSEGNQELMELLRELKSDLKDLRDQNKQLRQELKEKDR